MKELSEEIRKELANKVSMGKELNYKDKQNLRTPQKNPRIPREIVKTCIREVRESLGITAYELCRISGVSDGNLNKYEHGTMNISLSQLKKIALALGVSIDILVYGKIDGVDINIAKELIELRLFKKNVQRLCD